MKRIISVITIVTMLVGMFLTGNVNVYAQEPILDKSYKEIDYNTDFDDSSVYVVIRHTFSGYDRQFEKSDFPGLDIDYIEYITPLIDEEEALKLESLNHANYKQILLIHLNEHSKEKVVASIDILMDNDLVYTAYPLYDLKVEHYAVPNDTLIRTQSYLDVIDAQEAWDLETGDSSVRVGVIDTGISLHPDLLGNLLAGSDMADGTNVTWDDTEDSYRGHGTPVAGVIGAKGNNSLGVTGICWDISLMPFQDSENSQSELISTVNKAINRAILSDIDILNISSGVLSYSVDPYYDSLSNYTGLVVCGSGNDGKNLDDITEGKYYPAQTELENIITVGACNLDGSLTEYSNYGSTYVDVVAPGTVYTTKSIYEDDEMEYNEEPKYFSFTGTSFSAPQVTGVAALLKSYNSNLTALEIKQAILDSVSKDSDIFENINNLDGKIVTEGVLNAYNALSSVYKDDKVAHYISVIKTLGNDNYSSINIQSNFDARYVQFEDYIFGGRFPDSVEDYGTVSVTDATTNLLEITYEYGPYYESPWYYSENIISYRFVSRRNNIDCSDKMTISNSIFKNLAGNTISPTISVISVMVGDVSGNGIIDSGDYNRIYAFLNGTYSMDSEQMIAADANCDGVINSNDAVIIMQYHQRIINTFW